jgi:hypothetical protein
VVRRDAGWLRSDGLVVACLVEVVWVEHRGRWFLGWLGSWPLQPASFLGVPSSVE